MSDIALICGPEAEAGRSIIPAYVEHSAAHGDDAVALILPTARAAEQARAAILDAGRPGLYDPRIFTFPQLAEAILVANHHPFRSISNLQRELLLTDIIRQLLLAERLGDLQGYVQNAERLPGLVTAVGSVIDDLKRAAIEPQDFARIAQAKLPGHPANTPIAAIYELYQERLKDLKLYDAPGLFWEALVVLNQHGRGPADKCRPLDQVSLLLVDGFEEFTTTQIEMLQILSGAAERVVITLCLDESRPELFAVTMRTRERLQQALPRSASILFASPEATDASSPNLSQLRRSLFSASAEPIAEIDHTVEVFAAAGGGRAEVRELARRVKALLLRERDPVAPHEIAVVLRSFESGYGLAIREAFAAHGIPFEMSHGESIARRPSVQAVLDILDVLANDWRRADVVKLLNSSYVDMAGVVPEGREISPDEFEGIALEARIIGGKRAWTDRLAARSRRLAAEREHVRRMMQDMGVSPEDDEGRRLRSLPDIAAHAERLETCAGLLNNLAALLDPLEAARTWRRAVQALGDAMRELRIIERTRRPEAMPATVAADLAALDMLLDGLRELGEADEMPATSGAVEPGEFCERLARLCRRLRLDGDRRFGAGIQVLDVHEARRMSYRHVFVPGLTEGAFPKSVPQEPFYHDEQRRRLSSDRPILEERLPRQDDEAFLFYSALTAARDCVWLSYPTSDADGSPRLRSYYVDEVLRQFAMSPDDETSILTPEIADLSEVIRPARRACHPRELAEAALQALWRTPEDEQRARESLAALEALRRLDTAGFQRALWAAAVERERDSLAPPGQFDGALSSPNIHARLRENRLFGPDHRFSASRLSDYGGCPMQFFLAHVLGLDPLEEPTEEVQPRDVGSLAHAILRNFFRTWQVGTDRARPLEEEDLEQAIAEMSEEARTVFRSRQGLGAHRKLWQLTEQRLREDLCALLDWEVSHQSPPRVVARTEYAFGRDGDFLLGDGDERVVIEGRIDRIDIVEGSDPVQFIVFDYKLGDGKPKSAIQSGADLQLPLYCMAARKIAFGGSRKEPVMWAYYRVKRQVGWKAKADAEQIEELLAQAEARVLEHAAHIRSGRFALPRESNACRYCGFKDICRYNAARLAKKA